MALVMMDTYGNLPELVPTNSTVVIETSKIKVRYYP